MRHFLRRKLGPVSAPLHATRMEAGASWRALEPGPSDPHLLGTALSGALRAAVPLTTITTGAERHLDVAARTRAIEDPIPVIDHPTPGRQFLDKRSEASDINFVARPRGTPESSDCNPGFRLFWRQRFVTAPRSRGPERRRILALRRAERRNYADLESRRHHPVRRRVLDRFSLL